MKELTQICLVTGAIQYGVPTTDFLKGLCFVNSAVNPKSANLISPSEESNKLSLLISR
jgi:hypothetical protein